MKIFLFLILALFPIYTFAFSYEEPLADSKLEIQANKLFKEVRCVVCVSQSIAQSDTELAQDMRALIRKKLSEGGSEEQIKTYLVERYGNQVLFEPPVGKSTYLLWFAPIIFILLGIFILKNFIRKNN